MRDGPQQAVAGVVAEAVVRVLERAAVELDDADRPAVGGDLGDGLVPGEPVRQAGERVAPGLLGGPLEDPRAGRRATAPW